MKITAHSYFLWAIVGGLAGLFPVLRAELSAADQQRALKAAIELAAGRVAEADSLLPNTQSRGVRAEWFALRGRLLLREAQASAVALAAGRVAEAEKLQPVLAPPADRARWLELRGRWLLRDEKYAEAEKDFLAAGKLAPGSIPVAAGLAEVAWRRGRKEAALDLIEAAAELRKEQDPEARFEGDDPGVPHIFVLLYEIKRGGVDGAMIAKKGRRLGEAQPEALFFAARNEAKKGDLSTADYFCTLAIKEAGGKFPAAERTRQEVKTAMAQGNAPIPASAALPSPVAVPPLGEQDRIAESELVRLQSLAEAQLARGETGEARQTAKTALTSGRGLPTFAARQLLFARAATAVLVQAQPGPMKISDVDADTLEATHIFASVPELDAAAVLAETALLARLKKIDPLWPAGTMPAPVKLKADSSIMQLLAAEPLRAGSYRVVALEKAFVAEWGQGPTAVDLETAEGRLRWGMIGRMGAFVAHLRWLTLPSDSSEAWEWYVEERKRTVLALLCVPEDTAAIHAARQHAWFKEWNEESYFAKRPEAFARRMGILLDGKQGKDSAPPENGEELSALLTEVMPLADGRINLLRKYPGIATAVAARVTAVVEQLRLKRQEDVAFIAESLADFVWEWTRDPARALDVYDWGRAQQQMPSAQIRYTFEPPARLKMSPLGWHVKALDDWVWDSAEVKEEPVTPVEWAKVPSVVWRHALGSCGPRGNFKRLMVANRSGAWGMSLSVSSSVGQAVQLLDKRLGDQLLEPMPGTAGAEWLLSLLEIEDMLKEPGVMTEVRTRLGTQLNLHRAQVLIASGQRGLATKELPALVARLDVSRPILPDHDMSGEQGVDLAKIDRDIRRNSEERAAQARWAKVQQDKAEKLAEEFEAKERYKHEKILKTAKCRNCSGTGEVRNPNGGTGTNTYRQLGGTGLNYQQSYNTYQMKCKDCEGTGKIEYWEER